jgi:hypothetical protein
MHCATNGPGGVDGTLRMGAGGGDGIGVGVGRGVAVLVGVAASAGEALRVESPVRETASVAVAHASAIAAAISRFLRKGLPLLPRRQPECGRWQLRRQLTAV